jgi:hypothetical protein
VIQRSLSLIEWVGVNLDTVVANSEHGMTFGGRSKDTGIPTKRPSIKLNQTHIHQTICESIGLFKGDIFEAPEEQK